MTKKHLYVFMLSIAIIIALLVLIKPAKQSEPFQIIETPNERVVYLGAWVGGFWDSRTKSLDTTVLSEFEKTIGKDLAIANFFSEWTYLRDPSLVTQLNDISAHGWVPMISANPYFFDGCPESDESLYKTIASGACDAFLRQAGQNLRIYGGPIFLRFAWEMNFRDMFWSIEKTGSTPDEFIAAWRHFHTLLQKESVSNVIWVLSFNTSGTGSIPYAALFPGDEYVDWVAIDGYNWGEGFSWSKWLNFSSVFWNSYAELTKITSKPVMLSEVNSATSGGDKAEWLTDMLSVKIPEKYPQIEAVVFFNENKSEGDGVDWRIEKSPDYIQAVSEALKHPLYRSRYP